MNRALLTPLLAIAFLPGCPGPVECFRAIDCVETCGGPVLQSGCAACPAGTFDDIVCAADAAPLDAPDRDAATADAGADVASGDAGTLYPYHLIRHDCGPTDGPALRIGLYGSVDPACGGDPSLPSLTLLVYPTGTAMFPPTAGTVITSTTASASGQVDQCPGGLPPCRTSQDFTLTFDSYTDDVEASGTYTVRFSDGSSVSGPFGAEWCERDPILCG